MNVSSALFVVSFVAASPLTTSWNEPASLQGSSRSSVLIEETSERTPLAAELPGEHGDWYGEVSESIRQSEYSFSAAGDGALSAPNRAQGLRSRVRPAGIEVFARETEQSGEGAAWKLGLALSKWGRDTQLLPVAAADVSASENRVELARGPLVEWYVNDERGIEQGFAIAEPPFGGSADLPLVLEMALEGGLSARISEDRRAASFSTANGEVVLRYNGLHVFDAAHREVRAELVACSGQLQIRIHDETSTYPLHVDPVLEGPVWSAESDQNNAYFADSVSTAGDVNGDGFSDVIVGAYAYDHGQSDEGMAFVYLGSASGLAPNPAWTTEGDQVGAMLGNSVSTAGDVNGDGFDDVIIGASHYSHGQNDEGRALVYLGAPQGLGSSPAWTAEINQVYAVFGFVVSTAGDVNGDGFGDVIVSAIFADNGTNDEGQAFVYLGSVTGLAQSPAWMVEGNAASAYLGWSVATAGDVNGDGFSDVAVSSANFDGGGPGEGFVGVYHGSASGLSSSPVWGAMQPPGSTFGDCVATAGDVNGDGFADLLVGASSFDNGQTDEGRVFLYSGSATGLSTTPSWTAESNQTGAGFFPQYGNSVATAGDVNGDGYSDFLIGAFTYDNGQTDEGRAYLYLGSASGPGTIPAWTGENNQASSYYAISVAPAGDVDGDGFSDVIIGASSFDGGQTDEGRAYVYMGSSNGLGVLPGWNAPGGQDYVGWQTSMASAGDVNADGFSDVLVGIPQYDVGHYDEGRAYLYLGTELGLGSTPAWYADGSYDDINGLGANFGTSVASAGDVNGDGYDDAVIGAPWETNDQVIEGRAYVFLGSASGLSSAPAWSAERDNAGARFGYSVATAGDVNGDGFCDVLVGAPEYDDYVHDDDFGGEASLYLGSANGLNTQPAWIGRCGKDDAQFGFSVAGAGDVNGDGFCDVIIGAPHHPGENSSYSGRAFLYLGTPGGLPEVASWTADGPSLSAFGNCVSPAGDVDGDGFSDVIIGAPSEASNYYGWAMTYLGGPQGLAAQPAWTIQDDYAGTALGQSVAAAGDVNLDGFGDVILGAPYRSDRAVLVFLGSSTGLDPAPFLTLAGAVGFGHIVAAAGDVNGDGFADVLVADPAYSGAHYQEGQVLLHYGNGSEGLHRTPRQRRGGEIALHGKSPSEHDFKLKEIGRSAAGREDVRLEWEVERLGRLFDGAGIGRGAFTDTGVADEEGSVIELTETVGGLGPGTFFHWRVRVVTRNPFFPRSPWVSLPGNTMSETKLRTSGRLSLRPIQ